MRGLLILAVVSAASPAFAGPWADRVGDYRGSLTWRSCSAPGEKAAVVAVDAIDGALRIDLTAVGAGLRILALIEEDTAWVAQDGDLRVRVTQKKANTIELAIDFDSGCTARGQLARAATRIAACDRMRGWERIEAKCTKTEHRIDKLAKLDAARCTAHADKLALAMTNAGCAPHPDPQIGTRAVACRALADSTQRLARCARVPREIMQRLSGVASALSSAAQSAERATLPYVERQCKDAQIDVSATASQFGC